MKPSLDDLLDDISVHGPYDREAAIEAGNKYWAEDWWAVSTPEEGIIAYFMNERDAFRFRLDLINRKLNP